MRVPQRHLEKKNEASLFLAFAVCSRCSYGTGCRDCEAIKVAIKVARDSCDVTHRQACTPVMPKLQKPYKVLTAPRAINQQLDTQMS